MLGLSHDAEEVIARGIDVKAERVRLDDIIERYEVDSCAKWIKQHNFRRVGFALRSLCLIRCRQCCYYAFVLEALVYCADCASVS
jgi:hypothetical protein